MSAVASAVRRVFHNGRVWTIQGVGTLLWLALAYAALWIREAKAWEVAGSALLALFLVYLAAFLQRTALRVYRRARLHGLGPAQGRAARRPRTIGQWLPGAVLVAVLFALLAWLCAWMGEMLPVAAQKVASWLTLHLRRPVDPFRVQAGAESVIFLGPWFLFVVLWLPLAAAALLGEAGLWRSAARAWRQARYWVATLVCVAIGYFSFWKLAEWVPKVRGIPGQTASMVGRLALGYVIALGAWLVILALVEEAIASEPVPSLDDTQDLTPQ